jgi:hypothetical protein
LAIPLVPLLLIGRGAEFLAEGIYHMLARLD